jgi:hypothetical protein
MAEPVGFERLGCPEGFKKDIGGASGEVLSLDNVDSRN